MNYKMPRKELQEKFEILIKILQEITGNMPEGDPLRDWALLQAFLGGVGRSGKPEDIKYTPPEKVGA